MKLVGWIRYGDKAACGGTVIGSDPTTNSNGRPLASVGAPMACPKNCVIVEGHPFVTFDGKMTPHHGHRTSYGCPLISSLNDVHGWGAGDEPIPSSFYQDAEGGWQPKYGPEHFTEESPDEQVRAVDAKTGEPIPDLAYHIKAPDGTTYNGYTDAEGLCERVTTYQPEELTVWFGEEAEKKRQGA
ncbi:PAAR domain-containing protein [Ralstonia pseudosolanacearum]|uniref:PAAR domain-containing protein n=1 Tax=Ralstonia pseudosolanacearum TaxID=1310165 RepID=UPI002675A84D|nr:PAAR domain-containing protein [Ralstonia pseudosolanacearum]MDO3527518.1 PAAR domain-containing protein [Ralstonia pseudosolanacearum]MDO3531597.1 PAAR domain-containing protein [Ralstonia pseudosolanacearum]